MSQRTMNTFTRVAVLGRTTDITRSAMRLPAERSPLLPSGGYCSNMRGPPGSLPRGVSVVECARSLTRASLTLWFSP